jgi:two-component system OmpR family response regulator
VEERPLILVVDDQENIRDALNTLLSRGGFRVTCAHNAHTAIAAARDHEPDLVLLDVVLDETTPAALSGLDVLRAIRTLPRFIPVIMLTSYTEWQVESLGQGAIAFCTKPWEANALLNQIRSTLNAITHIRQDAAKVPPAGASGDILVHVADVEINLTHYRVRRSGVETDLTPIEFALLAFLARNPNRDWTREQLLNKVWGYEWVGYERTVDRHIAALRRKLKLNRDELIETIHGFGYRLVE